MFFGQKKKLQKVYLVSYDIKDDNRRNRLSGELLKYGVRVQYSIFEIVATESKLKKLITTIKSIIYPFEDSVLIYPLTEDEYKKTKRYGNKLSYGHIEDIYI